ncbi:hypothetical protein [Chromobacterium piscinae]|uniref:hypothetical protein n=1 Tax=Chromobacterium piscinae TaxID=686831 RepID=UPI0032618C73
MKTFKDTLKGLRQTLRQAAPPRAALPQPAVPEEADFRQSVGKVRPLKPDDRAAPMPKPTLAKGKAARGKAAIAQAAPAKPRAKKAARKAAGPKAAVAKNGAKKKTHLVKTSAHRAQ